MSGVPKKSKKELFVVVDSSSLRELREHSDARFPVEVLHDDLGDFHGHFIPCHWHEEWEFSVVRRGRALYHINGTAYRLSPGEGVLANSGVTHMVHPDGDEPVSTLTLIVHPRFVYGTMGSVIEHNYITPFTSSAPLAAVLLHSGENGGRVINSCLEAGRIYDERPYGWELKIKALFCSILFDLVSGSREMTVGAGSAPETERLKELLNIIHSRYAEKITLDSLAAAVSLSRESCCRIFKREMGTSIFSYLADYRVLKSLELLEGGRCSVTEAAAMVGFSSASRFARAFREKMRCAPAKYAAKKSRSL